MEFLPISSGLSGRGLQCGHSCMCTRPGPNFWAVWHSVFANCGIFRLCLVSCFGTVKGLQPSLLCQVVGFWLLTSLNQGSRKWKHRWFCHELSESNYDKLCAAQESLFSTLKNHHLKQLGFSDSASPNFQHQDEVSIMAVINACAKGRNAKNTLGSEIWTLHGFSIYSKYRCFTFTKHLPVERSTNFFFCFTSRSMLFTTNYRHFYILSLDYTEYERIYKYKWF